MLVSEPNNRQIQENLGKLYKLIGHNIREDYALIAITCSSFGNEKRVINQDSLAIVGDHVIKLFITSNAYINNTSISRYDLTNAYQSVETNDNLEKIGICYRIDDFLLYHIF